MSNVMMSMEDLKQAATFGSTFGKAVLALSEPTGRPVDVKQFFMAEAALIKRLETHMLKFKNFLASLAYFRLLKSLPAGARWLNLYTEAMRVPPESVTAEAVAQLKTVIRNIVDTPVPGQPPDRFGGQKGARLERVRAATADRRPNRPTPRTFARPQADGKLLSKRPPTLVQPVYERRAMVDHAEMRKLQKAYPENGACVNCGSLDHFVGKCTKPGAHPAQQKHSLFMEQNRDDQGKGARDSRPSDSRAALSFGFSNDSWADKVEEEEAPNIFRADLLSTALVRAARKQFDLFEWPPPQHELREPLFEPHELLLQHELILELEDRPNREVLCPLSTPTNALSTIYESKRALLVQSRLHF
mmetsp:Transcript_36180/g.90297  ORF Transcript_36180/g.90297 Transcript_36180/m.90297 type:complete len:359 (+) Transcript_36180:283-1359(+)